MTKGTKPRILLVEDNAFQRELLCRALQEKYEIIDATTGEQALDIVLNHERPDLVLLDIGLPGISGFDVCKRLKHIFGYEYVPIVFITAREDAEDQIYGLDVLHAADYIVKSDKYSQSVLVARLESCLRMSRDIRGFLDEIRKKDVYYQQMFQNVLSRIVTIAHSRVDGPIREWLNTKFDPERDTSVMALLTKLQATAGQVAKIANQFATFRPSRELPKELNANTVIDDILKSDETEEVHNLVGFTFNFQRSPTIMVSETEIKQVLISIILNSYEAAQKNNIKDPNVTILTAIEENKAVITIADDCGGFDPVHEKNIFDPFFTTKMPLEGAGLGLSVCKEALERNGGTIELLNHPNKGVTVTIKLPTLIAKE